MTSAHDRYLAGHAAYPVHVTCKTCEHSWDDGYEEEHGTGWLVNHEDCPKCGASGDELNCSPMDELDIQERRLEARGEDF